MAQIWTVEQLRVFVLNAAYVIFTWHDVSKWGNVDVQNYSNLDNCLQLILSFN